MYKILAASILTIGLATSAFAQGAGNSGSGNGGNSNQSGGSGAATTMQPTAKDNMMTNSTSGTTPQDAMKDCPSSTAGAGAAGSAKTDTNATNPACVNK
ncbi:hypothetical protein KX729_27275 [Rhizobium sp. XQZ8]|uniref:hypothetical protein n=1 Tax=Rhizobium populisoli TaxID=2859785 RepID=UPI001CA49ACE|nr:hypothetical protein [Rhizobium populisoli]MBW6425151.1 hypothetical protein [Rhizobium populisoli]